MKIFSWNLHTSRNLPNVLYSPEIFLRSKCIGKMCFFNMRIHCILLKIYFKF